MKQRSMTALVSAFARAFHAKSDGVKIFDDALARQLLTEEEYDGISFNMSENVAVFEPGFSGTREEALRLIVDRQLSPTPLGRSAFTEEALEAAVALGAKQYLLFAAGYDTFAYRQPEWSKQLAIFEIDHPATSADKQQRLLSLGRDKPANLTALASDFNEADWSRVLLECPIFDKNQLSFGSLLGISYYLTPERFAALLKDIASIMPSGSSLVFDYPDEHTLTDSAGPRAKRQVMMVAHAGEPFLASYSYSAMEQLLEESGWLIYRHLVPGEITEELFGAYNRCHPEQPITAFDNVNYCLAVKR
ncbi:methyltransferase [Paenibacillus oryzae]|uniref:S-adenosyl-L-methionine-dependent methyltransferase n=1 Tax=Paenibacillus oryzae TaxID=1844972 RepID=A0A1A5YCD3_9BACL|nr:class I SAM-dependent methyltransferase [Paenibacillus oryzae]OBR63258.1 methyltransferase [Paenibacillus oryzae]